MPNRIIDEFPTLTQAENATAYEIVCWYHYLRPTMVNDELNIVKLIARRYDEIPDNVRLPLVTRARVEYST